MARKAKNMAEVVPTTKTIDSFTLTAYTLNKATVEEMKQRIKAMENEMKGQEAVIMANLKAGAVAPEGFRAAIETKLGDCRPSWKDEWATVVSSLGKNPAVEEASVKARTPRKTTEILVVEKVAENE